MSKKATHITLIISLLVNFFLLTLFLQHNTAVAPESSQQTEEHKEMRDSVNKEEVYESGKTYPLMRIVDGDTIIVGFENSTEYVRLIGIDAPELNDPAGTQCYAQESTKHLQEIAQTGLVILHFDESQSMRDGYGRLLAYVEIPNGKDLGEQMLLEGYAREYTYHGAYSRQKNYINAEDSARTEKRGLWSENTCQ